MIVRMPMMVSRRAAACRELDLTLAKTGARDKGLDAKARSEPLFDPRKH
jgi:hypothetical protein